MADYARMERHIRYNKVATLVLVICILATTAEIAHAIKYHFPWYDDVAVVVSSILTIIARFVQKHTNMYRVPSIRL
jgi:hypothetical protein